MIFLLLKALFSLWLLISISLESAVIMPIHFRLYSFCSLKNNIWRFLTLEKKPSLLFNSYFPTKKRNGRKFANVSIQHHVQLIMFVVMRLGFQKHYMNIPMALFLKSYSLKQFEQEPTIYILSKNM